MAGSSPAILGHRGASAEARENTVAAFRLAAELGADGVELDVRRTSDDALVVRHDAELADRGPLVAMTLEEIQAADPSIPTFVEAMEACSGLVVNIEIKNWDADPDWDPDEHVAAKVAEWVRMNDAYDTTLLTSFSTAAIARVREVDEKIRTGWLVSDTAFAGALSAAAAAGHQAINPNREMLESDAVGAVRSADREGLWVIPWTVDDPREIRHLASAGVHGVITNDVRGALQALGR